MTVDNSIPDEWYLITAPQTVSWRKESQAEEISTYGTNNPYLNYGSTKLRTLSLKRTMLEGFSNAKEVESNVTSLESCMRMVIDSGSGYTAPYCWHVFAGSKSYGTYIIKSVGVDEKMRDVSGRATRAFVDIELQEVSPYQVTSGTDITSTAVVGNVQEKFASMLETKNAKSQVSSQDAAVAKANGAGGDDGGQPGSAASLPDPLKSANPLDAARSGGLQSDGTYLGRGKPRLAAGKLEPAGSSPSTSRGAAAAMYESKIRSN